MMNMRQKTMLQNTAVYVLLILFSFIALMPFTWMFMSSFKPADQVFSIPMKLLPEKWYTKNYSDIFQRVPFSLYLWNSFKVTFFTTLLQILTSTFAAYGFSKMHFRGRNTLFFFYICTIAIPWHAYMIPQYMVMRTLGLTNSHHGLVLLFSFTAFGVFLVRQFYLQIPDELCEAARIDGMSEYGIYMKIMLPLSKPVIATMTVFTFVNTWNDYMGSMIYISSDHLKMIQVGLKLFITQYSADYAMIMTGCVIALVPIFIVFIFSQKFFIEGIATTGMKG